MSRNQKSNVSRLIFFACAAVLVSGLAFSIGLYSGVKQNAIFHLVLSVWKDVRLVYNEAENLRPAGKPIHFLQPSRKPGSGVTINERAGDGSLVLLAGFFDGGTELRLIRRDGSPVARWPVRFSQHFPDTSHLEKPPATDRNIDIHGALVRPDGSIVFNYEYGGTVKLSRCGQTIWTLPHPTHHSIEASEHGGYWIVGRNFLYESEPAGFPPFTQMGTEEPYYEDLILKVSEDGAITEQMSIPRILYNNGLEPLMTAVGFDFSPNGTWRRELVHVNKIGELPSAFAAAFQQFEAGDLVLSLRQRNLIVVVDPDDWRVKWHQIGPWRRQHDAHFNEDGTISIFNNNVYRIELDENDRSRPSTPRVSNIIKVDPNSGRTEVIYGERRGEELLTVIRGKHFPTPEGGVIITEFEGGRAFEIDANRRIVWEYINRYDDEQVLEVTEARLYASSYFAVDDWSCADTIARK